jgi:hypothetical protein
MGTRPYTGRAEIAPSGDRVCRLRPTLSGANPADDSLGGGCWKFVAVLALCESGIYRLK